MRLRGKRTTSRFKYECKQSHVPEDRYHDLSRGNHISTVRRKTDGLHKCIAQRVWTEDLICCRRVLCETLELAIGIFQDETSILRLCNDCVRWWAGQGALFKFRMWGQRLREDRDDTEEEEGTALSSIVGMERHMVRRGRAGTDTGGGTT